MLITVLPGVVCSVAPREIVPMEEIVVEQWSLGYWTPGGNPPIPPSEIEWEGLTHVVHAWALVRPDGTLDLNTQRVSSDGPALIAEAHARGVKALLGIGQPYWLGQKTNLLLAATHHRTLLVDRIMKVVNTYGFDGVDLDWEPFDARTNGSAAKRFAAELRSRLGESRTLSAAAIVTDYAYWGSVHSLFDRIGVMTYDLTGTWTPHSWHNAALYSPGDAVWSVDLAVRRFTAAGVPPGKLSIGIPFFGYVCTGSVTAPRQPWRATSCSQVSYQTLAASYNLASAMWDDLAKAPYLSLDRPGSKNDRFITFENERSIAEKVNYAKSRGLGGWIIWELSGDYFPSQRPDQGPLDAITNGIDTLPSDSFPW
jgi:chitinase